MSKDNPIVYVLMTTRMFDIGSGVAGHEWSGPSAGVAGGDAPAITFSGRLPEAMHPQLFLSRDTEMCHPLFVP